MTRELSESGEYCIGCFVFVDYDTISDLFCVCGLWHRARVK